MTACTKVGKNVSAKITISKGSIQGYCIVPSLFKIYLNEVPTSRRKKYCNVGIPTGNGRVFTLHFADIRLYWTNVGWI